MNEQNENVANWMLLILQELKRQRDEQESQ